MLRKLTVLLIAALFSFSVAGVSFAAEEKKQGAPPATPATAATPATPAKKEGAANPCEEGMSKKKPAKKKADKKKPAAKKKAGKEKGKGEVPGPVEK